MKLTQRERDVLEGILLGQSNKHIAELLSVSDETVKVHVKGIMRKLRVNTRTAAAIAVMRAALRLPCPRCGYVDAGGEVGPG